MKAFIGLLYYRGLFGLSKYRINIIFSDRHAPHVFTACMSRMRFEFLLAHLCFDEVDKRQGRWQHDPFAAMRNFFERFICKGYES